ncbi:ras-related and estrogen-regulated growth inhibitor-like [Argopecten irradians]|uniref:ras-related and estrogen-regulated growth inhibitor-like n=1 Tax=Argopecten irradians TaxID=31199 RepID=UPI003714D5BD
MRNDGLRYQLEKLKENMRNMSSPNLLRKISMSSKQRPFRVVILGQNGVGKSALTVRFLTRRFIGEYDPNLEKTYSCNKCIDGDNVTIEVLDTAIQGEKNKTEENIKWADAYVLVYSVTDSCSFNECSRIKFLINSYCKRVRKMSMAMENGPPGAPCVLVGNQNDRLHDRMVTEEEGKSRAIELGCSAFYEISVRESVDSVLKIFEDMYIYHRKTKKSKPFLYKQQSMPSIVLEQTDSGESSEGESRVRGLSRRRQALYTIS